MCIFYFVIVYPVITCLLNLMVPYPRLNSCTLNFLKYLSEG